jgi:hypothetical protein
MGIERNPGLEIAGWLSGWPVAMPTAGAILACPAIHAQRHLFAARNHDLPIPDAIEMEGEYALFA